MINYGNSGCFCRQESQADIDLVDSIDNIDSIDETAEAVGDITDPASIPSAQSVAGDVTEAEAEFKASMIVLTEYLKRVRVLTWAVIALAVVVIIRETN